MNTQKPPHWPESLISWREALVDKITNTDAKRVLNSAGASPGRTGNELAAALKSALDGIKAHAFEMDGARVGYRSLRHSAAYQTYRRELSPQLRNFDPGDLKTRPHRIAFWINLYNALMLDAVIEFEVVQSVTEGRLGILAFFRRAAYEIAGRRLSSNDIEHGILRDNRGFPYLPGPHFSADDPRRSWAVSPLEPRIHFALNCASLSCPPIRIYTPENIGQQLDLAARNFVDQSTRVNPQTNTLHTSALFKWYQVDFGSQDGVIEFITSHLPQDERRGWVIERRHEVKLRYEPYDWGLNQYRPTQESPNESFKAFSQP